MKDDDIVDRIFDTPKSTVDKPKSPKFFMLLFIGLLAGGGVGFVLGLLAKGMMGVVQ